MVLVVGSGAGGATIARELAKSGINVTIIEKGPYIEPKKAHKYYKNLKKDIDLLKTECAGGSTLVAAGNAIRASEYVFRNMGIDLREEFDEVERELNVNTLPDSHFGNGTKRIMKAASSLGFDIRKMPKFIDPGRCKPCGNCSFGCPNDAKWTAINFIEEAEKYGANIIYKSPVTDIITEKGEIKGVRSNEKVFKSDIVILSPGAVETPRLLRKTGIKAGNSFFMDTFVTVGGILSGIEFNDEIQMNALIEFDDFILSPHFSNFLPQELQKYGAGNKDILGIMVKIKDELSGRVTEREVIKNNTLNDVKLLATGSAIAGSILLEAGVDPKSLISTHPRGAHPGGTAPIGKIVDKNLETEIKGLFVADASVFPESPGAPPILTIIALAKRLAKYLIENQLQNKI